MDWPNLDLSPTLGGFYDTDWKLADLEHALIETAICEGESFHILRITETEFAIHCRNTLRYECPFSIKARQTTSNNWHVYHYEAHVCPPESHVGWRYGPREDRGGDSTHSAQLTSAKGALKQEASAGVTTQTDGAGNAAEARRRRRRRGRRAGRRVQAQRMAR